MATGPRLPRVRGRAWAVTGLAIAGVLGLLFLVPVPWATRTEGVVWLPGSAAIRAETEGAVVRLVPRPGAPVAAGDTVAVLENPLLVARRDVLRSRVAELRVRLDVARAEDRPQARIVALELASEEAALERAEADVAALTLVAASPGRLEPAIPPEDIAGRFVRAGEVLAHILPDAPDRVRLVVPQARIDAARHHLHAIDLRLPEAPETTYPARAMREVPAGDFDLPSPVLGARFGGRIVVDPGDETGARSLERVFQFEVSVPPDFPGRFGARVHARLDHGTRPAGVQFVSWVRRVMLRGFDL
ncbi:MAG: hypothetical protein JJU40_14280 [Rhodobacteraceae bacterium]|nr:hypothetical protein [Paracoccaceae bacterium]